jgi:hypothetical protein
MAKFVEIYFHFIGQGTVRRLIINTDEIARIEEYKKVEDDGGGGFKEYTECHLLLKDGTECILERNKKEEIIKRLLEL